MSNKGFRKNKDTVDFTVSLIEDDCIVELPNTKKKAAPNTKAVAVFNELKDVYQKLRHVLGNSDVMSDFEKCLQYYHRNLIK